MIESDFGWLIKELTYWGLPLGLANIFFVNLVENFRQERLVLK